MKSGQGFSNTFFTLVGLTQRTQSGPQTTTPDPSQSSSEISLSSLRKSLQSEELSKASLAVYEIPRIKRRQLEIRAELAELKRIYHQDGISTSLAIRSGLEAELAKLDLDRDRAEERRNIEKMAVAGIKTQHFVRFMEEKLKAMCLGHVWEEVQTQANEQLKRDGLYETYRS